MTELNPHDIISAFQDAATQGEFARARRRACRLAPLDQLNVVEALRDAQRRLNLNPRSR